MTPGFINILRRRTCSPPAQAVEPVAPQVDALHAQERDDVEDAGLPKSALTSGMAIKPQFGLMDASRSCRYSRIPLRRMKTGAK